LDNATQNQAAVGLANMLTNLFMNSIIVSFSIGLATLVSQAKGQQDSRLCAVYLRRQQVISTLVFIPFATLLCFSEHLAAFMGQEKEIARLSQLYILITLPGFFFLN